MQKSKDKKKVECRRDWSTVMAYFVFPGYEKHHKPFTLTVALEAMLMLKDVVDYSTSQKKLLIQFTC